MKWRRMNWEHFEMKSVNITYVLLRHAGIQLQRELQSNTSTLDLCLFLLMWARFLKCKTIPSRRRVVMNLQPVMKLKIKPNSGADDLISEQERNSEVDTLHLFSNNMSCVNSSSASLSTMFNICTIQMFTCRHTHSEAVWPEAGLRIRIRLLFQQDGARVRHHGLASGHTCHGLI